MHAVGHSPATHCRQSRKTALPLASPLPHVPIPSAVEHLSHSVADTERIAADLARTLSPNTAIALHGDLGAGKTQFVRGLLIGLGGNPRTVSSPTYVLLNVYDTGRMPLYHLDAYRVAGPD